MQPFLKWAGGKRWLTSQNNDFLPDPTTFNRYFEPFLGGGAVFFYLSPVTGFLSDLNSDLVNCYQIIRSDWRALNTELKRYQRHHSEEFYYQIRSYRPVNPIYKAARFIYLNRTCWNGLYRVNKKGEFNVPIGTKTKVILETDDFEKLAERLINFEILVSDFENIIDRAERDDFVFIDPPYTVKHNLNGFIKYNETLFSWDDQIRLRNAVKRAAQRGAKVLILNADHRSLRELYENVGEMCSLDRASIIAGNSEARGTYTELAIKCW